MNDPDRINRLVDIVKQGLVREAARADRAEAELDRVSHELTQALAKIERMKWLQIYRPSINSNGFVGRCRTCSGFEGAHRTWCPHYEGPLVHKWGYMDSEGCFYNYQCDCGKWTSIEGMGEPGPCPDAALDWRGEKPEAK